MTTKKLNKKHECVCLLAVTSILYTENRKSIEKFTMLIKKNTKQNNSNTTKKQEHVCSVKIQPQNVEEHD